MTLADLIAGGETLTVELKKDANDHDLIEAVVCLANAQGGTLLVGVDDDGTVVFLPGSAADLDFVRWLVAEGRAGRPWSLQELLVLRACAEARSLSTEDAARAIQSDGDGARAVLARLVEAGVLEAPGERRGRSFHLSAAMYRVLGDKAAYVRVRGFEPAQQEQMVLQYAREHGQISRREAAELCKLSGPQATRLLKRVAEKHPELHLEGARRGARYVWRGAKPSRGRK